MERAFAAAHCDWRVITVEVNPANFQIALDGMRAMHFAAIRLFPEYHSIAASLAQNADSHRFDKVTSLMRRGDVWESWDNVGLGLLQWIQSQSASTSLALWLSGNHDLAQRLSRAVAAESFEPARLLRSQPFASSMVDTENTAPAETTAHAPSEIALSSDLQTAENQLRDAMMLHEDVKQLAIVGEVSTEQLALLSKLQVPSGTNLLLAIDRRLTRQQLSEVWPHGKVTLFTEADHVVAAEAYDFQRWTSKAADLELLRDAYDEYSDF